MLFPRATVFSMIKDLLRKLQRIISLQVGNAQHWLSFQSFLYKSHSRCTCIFLSRTASLKYQYIPKHSTCTGNFQLFVNIRTLLKYPLVLCRLYFLSTGRNLFLNLKKQASPQWRPIFITYSQKRLQTWCQVWSCACPVSWKLHSSSVADTKKPYPIVNSFSPFWEVIKPKPGQQAATFLCTALEKKRLSKTNSLYTMFMCPEHKHREVKHLLFAL